MRIVLVEIRNFRGIQHLDWMPGEALNCLIGAGDSTKTTIIDAIEYALTPRGFTLADDSDFFDLDFSKPVRITITLVGLPEAFLSVDKYGKHTRGWDAKAKGLNDEPGDGLDEALSVRLTIDESLEPRWSIFNLRIGDEAEEPPSFRYKDSRLVAPTRLGPYAERHLGWGRHSVLARLDDDSDGVNLELAKAARAARQSFRDGNKALFAKTVARAEELSKKYMVPMRDSFAAELDVQGVSISTGGISLHDKQLPLRRLGTGSARLLVSALQQEAGGSQISLIDEVEHGLEPHRIARLLKELKAAAKVTAEPQQVIMTTHSPVVLLELDATDLQRVQSEAGKTSVVAVAEKADTPDVAQRNLRAAPEAFLARKVVVGEGRTEQGLLRGLDSCWTKTGVESMASNGAIVVDGKGQSAPAMAKHLSNLNYRTLLMLDTDEPVDANEIAAIRASGGIVLEWNEKCSLEERLFLDVPWATIHKLLALADKLSKPSSVKDSINARCAAQGISILQDLCPPATIDSPQFRRLLGIVAKKNGWFKDISKGQELAEVIAPCLNQIGHTPFGAGISVVKNWIHA